MKEVKKLYALLPHWIDHNLEHARSYQEWAKRARAAGESELAAHIEAAAEKMTAANRDLEQALQQVTSREEVTQTSHRHSQLHHRGETEL
ncbi:MAG: hypothetical protein PVI59_01635 [Anaerolineae bacterium]|jgi:hypothetical protein